jgi:hypothetical protein
MLKEILNDPERKPITEIAGDLVGLLLKYRELPVHYFSRYLFKKGVRNVKDYVPNRLSGKIAPHFNEARLKQVLDNKLYFSLFYSQFGVKTPRIVAFNHKSLFASGSDTVVVNNIPEFRDYLAGLFKNNPGCDSFFVKKLYSSSSGRNIHLILPDYVENEHPALNAIFQDMISSEFVIQQRVKQHPELNRLNPYSLNTMRIDTFIDREGNAGIISGFIKMSTNRLPMDNNTSGGCGVGIDMNTGKLRKNGYSKLRLSGVGILTEHPITGVRFEDFTIPFMEETKELVLKAAGLMPGLRMVGWDVGVGEDHPVLVEGNSDYGINSNDLMYGGYMANDIFRKALIEFKTR